MGHGPGWRTVRAHRIEARVMSAGLTQADRTRLRKQHHLEQVSMKLAEEHQQRAERAEAEGDRSKARFHRKQRNAALRKAGAA